MKKIILLFVLFCFSLSVVSCQNKEVAVRGFSMNAPYSVKLMEADKNKEQKIRELLKKCDSVFNAYDEKSELGILNKNKKISLTSYNKPLFDIIKKVLPYCDEYFDISLRNVTALWDFNTDNPVLPEKKELEEALKTVGYENIVFNDEGILLKNGCGVELGAVAKGYAADAVCSLLKENEAIIDIGGTVLSTMSGKIKVGVKNPDGDGMLLSFYLESGEAVSTSGSYERYIEKDGKLYSHILNPKTGYSVDNNLVSVSVISGSALECDIYSTKYFLKGIDSLYSDDNLKAIFVTNDKKVYIKGDLDISDIDINYKLQEN